MANFIIVLLALLLTISPANATYVPGIDVSAGYDIVITGGSCPAGFTEDTAMRGFFAVGNPATGTVGNSLGTALTGTTISDSSFTPVGTVDQATLTATCVNTAANANCVTHTNAAFTGTANSTMRSVITPAKQIMFCKKT